MGSTLGLSRAVGRRLPGGGPKVDRNPGIELTLEGHKGYYLDALGQYRDFIDRNKLPVAVEVVDEPREVHPAEEVECPFCFARPYFPCLGPSSAPCPPHKRRIELFESGM